MLKFENLRLSFRLTIFSDASNVSPELKKKSLTFKAYLTKTFKWDFETE